jgi:hypothetical protein
MVRNAFKFGKLTRECKRNKRRGLVQKLRYGGGHHVSLGESHGKGEEPITL